MFERKDIAVLFCLLFITGCATTKGDWQRAQGIHTIRAYQDFLQKYPKSEFTAEAKHKIEYLDWQMIKRSDTLESYEKFINKYPKSEFIAEAKTRMVALDWKKTQKQNTLPAYQHFLKKYPQNEFTAVANERIETLSWKAAQNINAIESFREFIRSYPESRFITEAKNSIDKLEKENELKILIEAAETPHQAEQLLLQHAEMVDVIIPKLEQFLLSQIKKNGPGDRLVIKEEITSFLRAARPVGMTFESSSVLMEFPGDIVPIINNQPSYFGDHFIHRFKGRVDLKIGNGLYTFVSDDDKRNRLTFVFMEKIGYVYLRGKGSVSMKGEREVRLGY